MTTEEYRKDLDKREAKIDALVTEFVLNQFPILVQRWVDMVIGRERVR